MDKMIGWLSPILSTLVVCAGQLALNARFKTMERKRDQAKADTDAKRAAEAEWRESVLKRLDEQDESISVVMSAQCSQIRSDIIHKCHRYLDDLGKASTEEKESLHEEYEDYQQLCNRAKVENHFVDNLVARVMELPERDI